jgi:hypothetical protein
MQVDELAGLPQPIEKLAEVLLHDALRDGTGELIGDA